MKRLDRSNVPVVALSNTGRKRKENEDRFGVSTFRLEGDERGAKPVLLAVLSDGIGGHRAGEVAAEMAVDLISRTVAESDAGDPAGILTYAIQSASDAIRDRAGAVPDQAGMGATCACAWMVGDRLYTATVGDSRVYFMRGGELIRLSTDHTWVQEAVENGLLLPEEAAGHPNAHIIRRYLGSPVAPDVDLRMRTTADESDEQAEMNQGLKLEPGDRVLLTSDGLTDLVSDLEILDVYQRYPAEEATRLLIERANVRGGHDNITLVTFQVPQPAAQPVSRLRSGLRSAWRWVGIGCAGTLVVGLVIFGLASGLWWLQQGSQNGQAGGATATATEMQQLTLESSAAPGATATLFAPSATWTPIPLTTQVLDSGPTLTPWPTNTLSAP